MTAAQWERIQALYHRLSELPANQQAAAANAEAADDAVVLEELLALLNCPATGTLDAVVQQVAMDIATQPHEHVGAYRLEGQLGQGGMGTVYLGRRDDNEFERKVAIKFLNMGMERPEYVQRFRQERQILADLEHPHIARLLEGGQSSKGQPYLVMEYVDGKPLLAYCRENGVGREAILELVAKICDAVQYAHSRLVVHRDLKPSNILVTAEGEPKLLDFGIAKVLASGDGADEPLTRNAGQMLTLEYASPEQIAGGKISTASDVYSLGVILYEVLTGERPFRSGSGPSVTHAILHEEPRKPSLAARENGLESLPLELERVVLKAMAKEPEQRYASAAALADDLRRHLNGQPVLAHGQSRWYVMSKFVRRHRVSVALAAVLALVVAGLAVQLAFTNQRLQRERDVALRERTTAQQVSRFLVDLFGKTDPALGTQQDRTAKQILDLGAEQLASREMNNPEVRANLHSGIGAAYLRMGMWPEARQHLEQSMKLLRTVENPSVDSLVEALIEYSNVMEITGEVQAAERVARELVEVTREHQHRRLPLALSTLGNSLGHQLRFAEAEAAFREGLALADPSNNFYITLRANLALVLLRRGKFDEAREMLNTVEEQIRSRWGETSSVVGIVYDSRANLEAVRGDYAASVRAFEAALEHTRRYGENNAAMRAEHLCGLAGTYLRMREPALAEKAFTECALLRESVGKPDSFDALRTEQVRAMVQLARNDAPSAVRTLQHVLDVLGEKYDERHVARAVVLRLLGTAQTQAGDIEAARQSLAKAMEIRNTFHLEEEPEDAELLLAAGRAAFRAGDRMEAEKRLREAAAIWERLRVLPALSGITQLALAECLSAQGKRSDAEAILGALENRLRESPPAVAGLQAESSGALAALRLGPAREPGGG